MDARLRDIESLMGEEIKIENTVQIQKTTEKDLQVAREIADFLWKIMIDCKGSKGGNTQLVNTVSHSFI